MLHWHPDYQGITPFIGAICNCTNQECLGLRTLAMEVETLSRGEYRARIDPLLCQGCGLCAGGCQFGAISAAVMAGGDTVAVVDPQRCYGCGLCRRHCPQGAIALW